MDTPYPIKHDKKLTEEMLKTHYVSKVHLTGIKVESQPPDEKTNRYLMHWRITVECIPEDKPEPTKGATGSKTKKGKSSKTIDSKPKAQDSKAKESTKATGSKSKAQDSTKEKEKQKNIFIVVEADVSLNDIEKYGRQDIPAQMM